MELTKIKQSVVNAAKKGDLAALIEAVAVEADTDENDDEFLRVEIALKPTKKNIDAELEAAIERVEDAVAALDSRYPSVRFLDAA